jgi:hypothetical protein
VIASGDHVSSGPEASIHVDQAQVALVNTRFDPKQEKPFGKTGRREHPETC